MSNIRAIPIFFTVDESYAPYLDCAIRSIVKNAAKDCGYNYAFHVLHEDLSNRSMEMIKTAANPPFSMEFTPMESKLSQITEREENRLRCDYFTLTIYFRILIADIFPQYDRGIYLDSDIIVPSDISKLYNTDLEGMIIGACCDRSIQGVRDLIFYTENTVGVESDEYKFGSAADGFENDARKAFQRAFS